MAPTDSFNTGVGSALDGLDRRSDVRHPLHTAVKLTVGDHALGLHARVVHAVLCSSQGFKRGLQLLQNSAYDDPLIEQYVAR